MADIESNQVDGVWVIREPISGLVAVNRDRDVALINLGKMMARTDDFARTRTLPAPPTETERREMEEK